MRDFEPAKMKRVPFTGIRRVLEKANKLEAEGRKIVHFEVGQPDFDTPANIKEAAKKALDQGVTAYSSNYGDIRLRRAIAEKLERMNHLKVDPTKEIMVTCGGEEAVAAALFALLEKGDEVLIADPSYIPYSSLTKIAEAEPVYVPLDEKNGYCFDLEKLEAAVTNKTKLLILCTPGNPTGTMMDEESLRKLAEICCRHDILVLADEAYEQVLYDGNKHISIAHHHGAVLLQDLLHVRLAYWLSGSPGRANAHRCPCPSDGGHERLLLWPAGRSGGTDRSPGFSLCHAGGV